MTAARNVRSTLLAALLTFSFISSGYTAGQPQVHKRRKAVGPEAIPGEVIVKFKAGASQTAIAGVHRRHGTAEVYSSPVGKFKRVRVRKGKTVAQAVAALRKDPAVEYAEPNTICRAFATPSDPMYSYQWHLDIPQASENAAWHGTNGGGINVEPAWDQTQGSGVIVAVLDSGVAYENHDGYQQAPDLAGTTFVQGYDFINNDSHPNDDDGHGTHVAGTIAQSTNNGTGVAGVASACSIMPVKVLDSSGSGTAQSLADGLYYAADNGAKVINMSLGWPVRGRKAVNPGQTVRDAVAYAHGKGVTIVCASGNDGMGAVAYPAAYDDYCIAVGATRYDESRSSYSNYGSSLDIVAPGGDVDVDQNEDGYVDGVLQNTFNPNTGNVTDFGYWFFDGTSMATPHVSGVAALLIARGASTPDQVRQALESTAEDKGDAGWDVRYGHGLLDAAGAVASVGPPNDPPSVTITGPADGSIYDSGMVIDFAAAATDTEDGDLTASLVWTSDRDGQIGTAGSFSTTLSDGAHTVTASVTDSGGKTGSASVSITVLPPVGSITGVVTSDAGSPIEGALVATDTGQSAQSATDGTYTISGVPVGERSVTASADGYESQTQPATVAESATTNLDFALAAATVPTTVSVASIAYATEGGKDGRKHLNITVTLTDNLESPVANASVTISVDLDGQSYATQTATTGAGGTAPFNLKNAPAGTYTTQVSDVAAAGLTWDGNTPSDQFVK